MRLVIGLVALLVAGCAEPFARRAAESEFERACAWHLDGQGAQAEAGYRASLAALPNAPAANNLGVLAAERGDVAAAHDWFERATQLDDRDPIARANLGVVLFHLGRIGEAAEELVAARTARRDALARIPTGGGRVNWEADRYAAATARADDVAARYLDRIAGDAIAEAPTDLMLAENLEFERARF
jgi:tetratricopeptide (TPR) repeat protein